MLNKFINNNLYFISSIIIILIFILTKGVIKPDGTVWIIDK